MDVSTLQRLERRLLREYRELPGLSLTLAQVARLLSADVPACRAVLDRLKDADCLVRNAAGRYVRTSYDDDLEGWKNRARTCLAGSPTFSRSASKTIEQLRHGVPQDLRPVQREAVLTEEQSKVRSGSARTYRSK